MNPPLLHPPAGAPAAPARPPVRFDHIIAGSGAMRRALELARRAAANATRVLLTGETGTGKELVARAIHDNGPRAARPFVAVNCAAVPAELCESAFFGHERGAFTGALERRRGWFELAHGGTLFLDEVSSLPPDLQAKLLRVLQDGVAYRVGGEVPLLFDARIISATNRDLRQDVRAGRFREDLFYRLSVFPIHLPPLRERAEDVPALLDHFLAIFARALGSPAGGWTDEARCALVAHPWPGNVRELQNAVERLVLLADGPAVGIQGFEPDAAAARTDGPASPGGTLREARAAFERTFIRSALERAEWNRTRAATFLGVNRKTLTLKMKSHRLRPPWAERSPAGGVNDR
jgi:DNA-binding NtrC family response regulator